MYQCSASQIPKYIILTIINVLCIQFNTNLYIADIKPFPFLQQMAKKRFLCHKFSPKRERAYSLCNKSKDFKFPFTKRC